MKKSPLTFKVTANSGLKLSLIDHWDRFRKLQLAEGNS